MIASRSENGSEPVRHTRRSHQPSDAPRSRCSGCWYGRAATRHVQPDGEPERTRVGVGPARLRPGPVARGWRRPSGRGRAAWTACSRRGTQRVWRGTTTLVRPAAWTRRSATAWAVRGTSGWRPRTGASHCPRRAGGPGGRTCAGGSVRTSALASRERSAHRAPFGVLTCPTQRICFQNTEPSQNQFTPRHLAISGFCGMLQTIKKR